MLKAIVETPGPHGASPAEERRVPDWPGLWEDATEYDGPVTDIEGKLPAGLVGTLYRNGPAKRSLSQHYFDGDGMVRRLRIAADGTVHYKSAFVHTPRYLAERGATRPLFRGAGTNLPGGVLTNALRMPKDYANTNVVPYREHLLAMYEGGPSYVIDPETLQTRGVETYDDAIGPKDPVSAHPHFDPRTGETFNFGLSIGKRGVRLNTFKLDSAGKLHRIARTPVPYYTFMHDFALSERWMGFSLPPVKADLPRMMLGLDDAIGSMKEVPGMVATLMLISRDGKRTLRFETDPCVLGHVIASRDEGDEFVMDFVRLNGWDDVGRDMGSFRTSGFESFRRGELWRYRFNTVTMRVQSERLLDAPADFPRGNETMCWDDWRYAYIASNPYPGCPGLVRCHGKLDLKSGEWKRYDHGPGSVASEGVFVNDPQRDAEDGGWLIAYVHNGRRAGSDVVIFDAEHIEDGPLATMRLPVSAGTTFHGSWVQG